MIRSIIGKGYKNCVSLWQHGLFSFHLYLQNCQKICPEENLALNHQTDCTTSTQIWVINFDSIKSQENIFMKKILIQRQSWMLLCPEKADLCLITRLNMTRVLECVLQLLANEHTSPFLRVVRTACPGWRGSV